MPLTIEDSLYHHHPHKRIFVTFTYVISILGTLWMDNTSLWLLEKLEEDGAITSAKVPISLSPVQLHPRLPTTCLPVLLLSHHGLLRMVHFSLVFLLLILQIWVIFSRDAPVLSSVTLKLLWSLPGLSFNFRISIWFIISIPLAGRGPHSKLRIIGLYFYPCWISWASSMGII